MRSLHPSWLASGLLLLAACEDGTSTGNPNTDEPHGGDGTGTGEVSNGGGNCKEVKASEISVDAQTALGFSPADLLTFVEGTHEQKLSWNPQGFKYGPETGEHGLTLTIAQKGAPRLVQYKVGNGNGLGEIALVGGNNCSDAVEIDVAVTIATDQGALNETFETTIVARNAKAASLYKSLDASKVKGSFAAEALPANSRLTPLSVSIQLTKYGSVAGSVSTGVETTFGGANGGVSMAAGSREPLASFGPQGCLFRGTPVPRDASVDGISGDDMLKLVNRAQSGTVSFDGAAASSASLTFALRSDFACAVLDDGYATFGGAGSLYLPAVLRIKTTDGRIDGSWQVALTATRAADNQLDQVRIAFDDAQIIEAGTLSERYGINGLDVARFDNTIAQLDLSVSNQTSLNGELTVTGFTNVPCNPVVTMGPDGSGSSSGCAGAMSTRAAHALITTNAAP